MAAKYLHMMLPIRILSDLVSRAKLAMSTGTTFGGDRDLYQALGYKIDLRIQDYRARFKRGGIARRIITAYPDATWNEGVELIEDDNPNNLTPFEEVWERELVDRLHVWEVFNRTDSLSGIGRYAILLIGVEGKLSSEIPSTFRAEDIAYLRPYAEDDAELGQIDLDESSPRYGQPLFYRLKRGKTSQTVHWSRVLHFVNNVMDDEVCGDPVLEDVWNYLDDLDKVVGAGSEAFWRRADPGLIFDQDKDLEIDDEEAEKIADAAEEFQHGLKRILATRGMTVKPLSSNVSDFSPQAKMILTLISATKGIPIRILLGSERGELASSQDRNNWDTRVYARRRKVAEPYMIRKFVGILTEHKAVPEPKSYDIRWPEISELNMQEQAVVASAWSELNSKSGGTVVTPAEIRDLVLRLAPLKEEEQEITPIPPDQASLPESTVTKEE